jgi:hypothetical protein
MGFLSFSELFRPQTKALYPTIEIQYPRIPVHVIPVTYYEKVRSIFNTIHWVPRHQTFLLLESSNTSEKHVELDLRLSQRQRTSKPSQRA